MNTPLLYSMVPMAPSKTTMAEGSRRRSMFTACHPPERSEWRICSYERRSQAQILDSFAALGREDDHCGALLRPPHRIVLRLWMMHDDRRGALLGDQLKRARELHAELALGRQNLEQLGVILEVRTRTIAPRIPLALTRRHAQIVAELAMQPLGDCLSGFNAQAVHVKRFGVLVRALQRLEALVRFVADGDDLERDDVDVARFDRAKIVRDAQPFAAFLSREVEARQLARCAVLRVAVGIVHQQVVP